MRDVEVLIIGGGPAGLAAGSGAFEAGSRDILILEREDALGGILRQCIHNGFGLHTFKEELTGPEYAARYVEKVLGYEIAYQCGTMVTNITGEKIVTCMSRANGLQQFKAKSVVLAMGCRERPRGSLATPGTRCAGIYTAGTAQMLVNMQGLMPGKRVVILGSGDIGLIMARRMTFVGAQVLACVEIMPFSSGLKRNVVQCLDDYDIPLLLSHTVIDIKGKDRLESVVVARVDEKLEPIPGTERIFDCDTLLLSVGLIPENELSSMAGVKISDTTGGAVVGETLETSVPGIFSCGNVLHVHDLVDFVSEEAHAAGVNAHNYATGSPDRETFVLPPRAEHQDAAELKELTCISCPLGCRLTAELSPDGTQVIAVSGQGCDAGKKYAEEELTRPTRMITSLVNIGGAPLSVKTSKPIDKSKIFDCLAEIQKVRVVPPVKIGSIIIKGVCGTDVDIVATRSDP